MFIHIESLFIFISYSSIIVLKTMSAQADLNIPTDLLPTQNIGLLDQNQPQIYSLLAHTNNPTPTKQVRRRKASNSNEKMPVIVNPRITATPRNVAFAAPQYISSIPQETMPTCGSTRYINGHRIPLSLYLDRNSYDTNNNINHTLIPALSLPLNPSLPMHTQRMPTWVHSSFPSIQTKVQHFEVTRSLNNNVNERTMSVPLTQQNEYNHFNPSLTFVDQGSLSNHSLSSSAPSSVTSEESTVKPKRSKKTTIVNRYTKLSDLFFYQGYSKKISPSVSAEQIQQNSSYPITMIQPTVSDDLPTIIPAFVTVSPPNSEEHTFPMDLSTESNFAPLTPPTSISSLKSSPTSTVNESSSIPVQHLLPYITPTIADINPMSKQYFLDQRFSHTQKTIPDSSLNNLPYNLHQFSPAVYAPYCMVPSNSKSNNILPITYSPISSETTVNNISSMTIPTDIEREKSDRKSENIQKPGVKRLSGQQSSTSKPSITCISTIKKEKNKKSSTKDIRTKKQLRRITRKNRLAVLKFMMRKRKHEKQQHLLSPSFSEPTIEQIVPKLIESETTEKPVKIEQNLPDIIAPNLKITLDASQKIESITLYYHRRRKPIIDNQNSPKTWSIADNKLDLLIEALEYMETSRGNLKLPLNSNK